MNTKLEILMAEAIQDNRAEKLCLIDDIVRAKKFLFAQGRKEHNEFILPDTAGKLFDTLYEYNHDQLTAIRDGYTNQINQIIRKKVMP